MTRPGASRRPNRVAEPEGEGARDRGDQQEVEDRLQVGDQPLARAVIRLHTRRYELQCDGPAQPAIVRAVDHAHAAAPEPLLDDIVLYDLTGISVEPRELIDYGAALRRKRGCDGRQNFAAGARMRDE